MVQNRDTVESLRSALIAAEDLSAIAASNLANSQSLGYKALKGHFVPEPLGKNFGELLSELRSGFPSPVGHGVRLHLTQDETPGQAVTINGKTYQRSNVDLNSELQTLAEASLITRAAVAALRVENSTQQNILNLGR